MCNDYLHCQLTQNYIDSCIKGLWITLWLGIGGTNFFILTVFALMILIPFRDGLMNKNWFETKRFLDNILITAQRATYFHSCIISNYRYTDNTQDGLNSCSNHGMFCAMYLNLWWDHVLSSQLTLIVSNHKIMTSNQNHNNDKYDVTQTPKP